MNFVLNSNWPAYNIRLYASWAFSNGPSALEFQINFSNLALTNRVYSGQASSRNNPSLPCVKPLTLAATLTNFILRQKYEIQKPNVCNFSFFKYTIWTDKNQLDKI